MTKLTDLKGSENLLQKVDIVNTIEEHVHNTIVKEYNSLSIDGDVDILTKEVYGLFLIGLDEFQKGYVTQEKFANFLSKAIIANLDKFVVIKKG